MTSVDLHPAAEAELAAATDWYLARSAGAAAEFVREIEHGIERIARSPLRYPVTRFGRRRFVLLKFPYDLVYRIVERRIEVIAVAHHGRRPGYWSSR